MFFIPYSDVKFEISTYTYCYGYNFNIDFRHYLLLTHHLAQLWGNVLFID